MPRPTSVEQEISLFRSRIQNRWVDDVTIRLLESILVSKDVQSSIEVRSVLKRFMRDESLLIFGEITEESVEIKLICTEFLIRIFAMIGDVESCLALRYEALVMRDERATLHPELQVTSNEWLIFAEHSLENGFYSIASQESVDDKELCYLKLEISKANFESDPLARWTACIFGCASQACERAHMYSGAIHLEPEDLSHDMHAMEKINRLNDTALQKNSSQSVQAQAKAYLKKKNVEQSTHHLAISTEAQIGSSLFKSGIKKHNLRKFCDYQRLRKLSR